MTEPFSTLRVAIACGGTGGHLFPGLAVGRELTNHGCAVTLLISPKEVDQEAARSATGMEVRTLPAVGLQSGRKIGFAVGFLKSLVQTIGHFRTHRPDAALAMGGFTSAPPILAARRTGARTALHESNSVPGRANRWLARIVDHAFVGFPGCAGLLSLRSTVSGTPVRAEFEPVEAHQCRTELGLVPDRPVLLVMGGSQGASGLNQLVVGTLRLLREQAPSLQFIHLTGVSELSRIKEAYASCGAAALVYPFYSEVSRLMGAATLAISRAGASSMAEIAAMQLPAILVPYPAAVDNHQFHNARAFAQSGAAVLLEQQSATPDDLLKCVLDLVQNGKARQAKMAALSQWHRPNAARDIAEFILSDALSHRENRMRKRQSTSRNPFAVALEAEPGAAGSSLQPGRPG